MHRQTIPVHLETKDTLVFGLTAKQVMVLSLGITLAYAVYSSLPAGSLLLLGGSLLVAAVPIVLALLVAFVRPAGQGLDAWAMIWLLFVFSPKTYLWEPLADDDDGNDLEPRESRVPLEEED